MKGENIFIAIIASIAGISMLVRFIRLVYYMFKIKKWLPAEAKIIDFDYEQTEGSESIIWERKAKYAYVLGDIMYFNNKISNDMIFGHHDRHYAEYWYDKKYFPGQQVTIYYNPKNPNESVIENTFGFINYTLLFSSAVFFLYCIL